ncbi:MAG: SPOR domain-containing protein [Ottowia sp.]|uniref:SPOR domain-containing protein n=1 Tax=Ottowia sp. TaxID=1898956 RepID=UPI0039E2293F
MAFFKFRQRGQPQPEPRTRADAPAAGAQETVDGLRRRARHRLVGAAVLVLVAVIGFPLLFDTQPRPVAVDAPITIPDKDKAPPLRGPEASRGNNGSRVAATASLDEREEVVAPAPRRSETSTPAPAARPAEPARDTRAEDEARVRREAEAKAKREAEQAAKAKREEAARARAALEGQNKPAAATPAAAGDDKGRFIVQVGAFAEADKVREVRQQAERAGLKTYTQVVDTKEGKRTRVRVGPFATRAEAEKAAAALQKVGLTGGIYAL